MANFDHETQFYETQNISKLRKRITSLYLNETFSDVTLILHGEKIHAHKVILAISSSYFAALFFGNLKESYQKEVVLHDVPINGFKQLLKFIYTSNIDVVDLDLTLDVLDLANRFCMNDFENQIAVTLCKFIDMENVCKIIQRAQLYNLPELLESCLKFIDKNAGDFLASEQFNNQPESILVQVLIRDSFPVPEVMIFQAVADWQRSNGKRSNDLLACVRLSCLTSEEMCSVVKPTKLIEVDVMLKAMGEITGIIPRISSSRYDVTNVNIASTKYKAQVISKVPNTDLSFLLNDERCDDKFATFPIGDTECFQVKLVTPSYVNSIQIEFHSSSEEDSNPLEDSDDSEPSEYLKVGVEKRSYRYFIESSIDQKYWKKIVDYSNYDCRGFQELYFEKETMQYIRIVGVSSTQGNTLDVVSFKAYYKEIVPKLRDGLVCPPLLSSKRGLVVEGEENLHLNCINHRIGQNAIVIQLAQPYMIDFIKLRLCNPSSTFFFKYFIETSINKLKWSIAVDRRYEACRSWQVLHFAARPVVYIRITGTYSCISTGTFSCSFEGCAAVEIM